MFWCPECWGDMKIDCDNCPICGTFIEKETCKTCKKKCLVDSITVNGECFDCYGKNSGGGNNG